MKQRIAVYLLVLLAITATTASKHVLDNNHFVPWMFDGMLLDDDHQPFYPPIR